MKPDEQEILWIMEQYHITLSKIKELEEIGRISENMRIDYEIKFEELFVRAMKILFDIGYGMVFTIDNFMAEVYSGCISDYDGRGIFYDKNGNKGEYIICDIKWIKNNCKDYDFIVWFNK